jgi:hypothetical protein
MNLLPQNEIGILKKESTMRLIIVICFLIIFLEIVAVLMLLPSYVVVNSEKRILSNSSEQIKKSISGKGSIESELNEASGEVKDFISKETAVNSNITDVIKAVLSLRPKGITSNSISVIQNQTGKVVQLSGVGASREALIEYQRVISTQDFVKEVHYLEKFIMQKSDINYNLVISLK